MPGSSTMPVTASTRGTTWALPLVLALAVATCSSASAASASASAAAAASTTTPPPHSSAPRAPGQTSRRLFEAETGPPAAGRVWRRRHESPAATAAARNIDSGSDNDGRILFSGASRTTGEGKDGKELELQLDRQQQERPSPGSRWTETRTTPDIRTGATRRRSTSLLAARGSGKFMPAAFVASPATPFLGQAGRKRRSSSSGLAVGRFEEGIWCAGRAGVAQTGRPWQPLGSMVQPWGGGSRGGGSWRNGGRSSQVVVVGGGAGETEYYSWTETESDIEVRVSLPPGTKAKSVQLSVTKTAVTLGLKGREGPVLKGSLKGQVQADESHWTMEEMDDTGEKVLYLCLEKAVDMEALAENTMPEDWEGVLEGEEPLNLYYPDKDKDFDVDEYVKRMGYDRERDIDKVDKTMFSDLTAEMKQNLQTTLPKTAFTEKDDMIPVMADPKVSPVIDKGVLGLPTPPPRQPEVVTDVTVNVNADGTVGDGTPSSSAGAPGEDNDGRTVDMEKLREESWAAGFAPDLGGAAAGDDSRGGYSPAGFRADAEFDVPMKGPERDSGELTVRQREVSAGLRNTYEKLVKRGMIKDTNPDGTPAEIPDMDEMARAYETEGFMFKEGDFTEEELSKYMDMDMGMGMGMDADLPSGEIDLNDPDNINNNNINTTNDIMNNDNNTSSFSTTQTAKYNTRQAETSQPGLVPLYKSAARNLRGYHGVLSMTVGSLEKTMALLQLRPGRLVAQGLASRKLLKGETAMPDDTLDSSSSGGGNSEVEEVQEENRDNSSDVSDSNTSSSTSGDDNDDNDGRTCDLETEDRKRPIHAALTGAGIKLRPREIRPLLLALGALSTDHPTDHPPHHPEDRSTPRAARVTGIKTACNPSTTNLTDIGATAHQTTPTVPLRALECTPTTKQATITAARATRTTERTCTGARLTVVHPATAAVDNMALLVTTSAVTTTTGTASTAHATTTTVRTCTAAGAKEKKARECAGGLVTTVIPVMTEKEGIATADATTSAIWQATERAGSG
eukprot:g13110.t1